MKKISQDNGINKLIDEFVNSLLSDKKNTSQDLDIKTLEAKNHGGKRDLQKLKWIVIHSTENDSASGTARYFQQPTATGSTHFVVGEDSVWRTLPDIIEPWGAPGANRDGLHVELVGYAKFSKEDWLKRIKTLEKAAQIVSNWCGQYNIPKQFVSASGLVNNIKGITTHAEVSKAFKKTDHTDPGINFPMAYFISLL